MTASGMTLRIAAVQEYQSLSFWGRLRYRTYRHPLVMFGIGPAYLFLLQHRLPVGLFRGDWWPWLYPAQNVTKIVRRLDEITVSCVFAQSAMISSTTGS
jgi:fatty acid desaturase